MRTPYALVSATVFALVAIAQIVRATSGWALQVGPYSIPIAFSWVVALIAIVLSVWGFRAAR